MSINLNSLVNAVRVSTVLDQDTEQYGHKNIFDGRTDTCWNSDEGTLQFVMIRFKKRVNITSIRINFQGGFSCVDFTIFGASKPAVGSQVTLRPVSKHHFDDSTTTLRVIDTKAEDVTTLKINMSGFADFFGRVIIYGMDILGSIVEEEETSQE